MADESPLSDSEFDLLAICQTLFHVARTESNGRPSSAVAALLRTAAGMAAQAGISEPQFQAALALTKQMFVTYKQEETNAKR